MNKHLWQAADQLANELARSGADWNVIRTAAAYARTYSDADMRDWLQRFAELGDRFDSSGQTNRYRVALRDACLGLSTLPQTAAEWAWVLGWAGRLYLYYAGQRPGPSDQAPGPTGSNSEQQLPVEEELPEVREDVAPLALKVMEFLKSKDE